MRKRYTLICKIASRIGEQRTRTCNGVVYTFHEGEIESRASEMALEVLVSDEYIFIGTFSLTDNEYYKVPRKALDALREIKELPNKEVSSSLVTTVRIKMAVEQRCQFTENEIILLSLVQVCKEKAHTCYANKHSLWVTAQGGVHTIDIPLDILRWVGEEVRDGEERVSSTT